MRYKNLFLFPIILLLLSCRNDQLDPGQFSWFPQNPGTRSSIRGISALNENEVWVSGSDGFCAKSSDSGKTWQKLSIPGTDSLDFRDIHVFENDIVYLMSVGNGFMSRIYKTEDGGNNWILQLENPYSEGFFCAMAFWNAEHGIVFSDPVDGKFVLFKTTDGGNKWTQIAPEKIPPAIEGEYAFAASGTCLFTKGEHHAWFGTGGTAARVFRSSDNGESWQVTEIPFVCGTESSGIFSLTFKDALHGIAVGGDYQKPNLANANVAISINGGKTWHLVQDSDKLPYRSCVTFLPPPFSNYVIAVGRSGSDYSVDNGETWQSFGHDGYFTLSFSPSGIHGWAAGSDGRVAKFIPANH